MPSYKVSYFTFKGLGEPVRFMLAYANVDFIDNRVEWEDWPKLKPTLPLGQLPLLEIDGRAFHHCIPICRYLGSIFNLTGSNAVENYEIDCIADTVNELRLKIAMWYYSYKRVKNEKYDELINDSIPYYLGKIEDQAATKDGYLALKGKTTWADIYAVAIFDYIHDLMGYDIVKDCKNIKKIQQKIMSADGVKRYLKNRPADQIITFN
ncbi:hypothetical protein PVAND_016423 [Polypedilum vanderplanki]|uniref:glutathione transferase n=1 Tax=Polypedilum vanderplanki TaxID=319348 RepID=A0A9J6BF40_POLVA|nr:hypothetical protein PVAND_016423 [Polypedilum vanderplanki]